MNDQWQSQCQGLHVYCVKRSRRHTASGRHRNRNHTDRKQGYSWLHRVSPMQKTGACVFSDIVNEIAPKFAACDGIIIGSPVYYASANGTLISFIDRLFYSVSCDKTMKVGAAVVSCRRGGASATFDELNKYFTISGMPVVSSQYWYMAIHQRKSNRMQKECRSCVPWVSIWRF